MTEISTCVAVCVCDKACKKIINASMSAKSFMPSQYVDAVVSSSNLNMQKCRQIDINHYLGSHESTIIREMRQSPDATWALLLVCSYEES